MATKRQAAGTSKDPPEGVVIRRAAEGDLKGVRRMTENMMAFEGADFFVSNFLKYIQDPDRYVYVALKDGKVVGSVMHYIVDGGSTMLGGGVRVHPAFQKTTNLYRALRHRTFFDTLKARPSLQKARACSLNTEYCLNLVKTRSARCLSSKRFITMAQSAAREDVAAMFSPSVADALRELHLHGGQITSASKEDLRKIFLDEDQVKRVFPGNVLCAGPELFEPCVENLPALFSDDREFTISEDRLSVAVAEFWHSQLGFICCVNLHGEASAETAMAHFVILSERAVKRCPDQSLFTAMYSIPDNVPSENLSSMCEKLPFYRSDRKLFDTYFAMEWQLSYLKSSL